jgi:hypothetical protein
VIPDPTIVATIGEVRHQEKGHPVLYRIQVRGRVSPRVSRLFPGFDAQPRDTATDLVGPVEDQAALFAVMQRARDLGLELIAVVPLE